MAMSRKDYVAIADAIANANRGEHTVTREEVACRIASVFAADNPRFDRGRFLTACGFDS